MVNIDALCPGCMTDKKDAPTCRTCGEEFLLVPCPQALPVRTVLNDRFLIGRVLGRPGGFGITYLAWDLSLQTTAAIKEFLPSCSVARESGSTAVIPNSEEDHAVFSEGLQMFLEEARTLAQFSHPNITRIRDFFSANNTAYLVMDYHEGQTLDQYARQFKEPLAEDRALEIMLPVLDGLKAVHEKNFLHRDIKPQNIYLTEQMRPILLDFGAARYAIGDKTSTLTIMLTSGFAPFEQYHQKGRQGPWTDLYACAATLYFLTTGKVPPDAIERQHQDNLAAPIHLNPGLSESFNHAIFKTLAKDYRDRPKSVAHFLNLLLGTDRGLSTDVLTQKITSTLPPTERQLDALPPYSATKRAGSGTIRRTNIRNSKNERKSATAKALLTLILIFVGIVAWKPSQTNRIVETSRVQPARSGTSPEPEIPETDSHREDFTLSYANMPEIDTSGDSFFSDTEETESTQPTPRTPSSDPEPTAFSAPNRPPQSVPPEAFQACSRSSIGATCRFSAPHGAVAGQCNPTPLGKLVCHPLPPPRLGAHAPRLRQARRR